MELDRWPRLRSAYDTSSNPLLFHSAKFAEKNGCTDITAATAFVEEFVRLWMNQHGAEAKNGRISATGALGMFIQFAHKLNVFQDKAALDHLPKWATTEYFDIEAKAPRTDVTKDQMRLMMQSLLADRFKLVVHFEARDVPAMTLVRVNPDKLGPRLRPHSTSPACDTKIPLIDRSSPKIPDVWVPAALRRWSTGQITRSSSA